MKRILNRKIILATFLILVLVLIPLSSPKVKSDGLPTSQEDQFRLPFSTYQNGLTWAEDYIWITVPPKGESESTIGVSSGDEIVVPGGIMKINPLNGSILYYIQFEKNKDEPVDPRGITWDGQTFWIVGARNEKIYQLNPSTLEIQKSINTPKFNGNPQSLAWDGNYLWHYDKDSGKIYRMAPENGDVIKEIRASLIEGITWWGGNLWVSQSVGDGLEVVDPKSEDLKYVSSTIYEMEYCPLNFDIRNGVLWILDYGVIGAVNLRKDLAKTVIKQAENSVSNNGENLYDKARSEYMDEDYIEAYSSGRKALKESDAYMNKFFEKYDAGFFRKDESYKSIVEGIKKDDQILKNQFSDTSINTTLVFLGREARDLVNASFETDYMKFNGEIYKSQWKEEDYCLIKIEEYPINNYKYIIGTHRYGTKAGALYYAKNKPQETTLIHWENQNNDQEPQIDEIEMVKS